MKAIFTQDQEHAATNSIVVSDMKIIDIVLDDAEVDDIVIDDFLSMYTYQEAGQVLNKIISKLRLNGTICINFIDATLVSQQVFTGTIDLEEFNNRVFFKARKSLFDFFIIKDLLTQNNIKITDIKMLTEFGKTVMTGVRYE